MTTDIATTSLEERLSMRDKIKKLMEAFKAINPEGVTTAAEYPLHHEIRNGVYVRTIFMPKGHLVIGKIHRYENVTIIKKGGAFVVSENHPKVQVFAAGDQIVIPPMNANVLITFDDTEWTTIHPLSENFETVEQIEEHLIIPTHEQLEQEFKVALLEDTSKE